MWGNALGWIISAAMVLAYASAVAWVDLSARTISPRTEFSADPRNNAELALPVSPRTVLPGMSGTIDAVGLYREAIAAYQANPAVYDRFARSGRADDIESVPAVKLLIDAAPAARARLFDAAPAELVNYNNEKPPLDALRVLAACTRRAGQLLEKARPTEALRYYEAVFSLGAKLYEERLTYAQLDAGLMMLAEGGVSIASAAAAAGDAARARQARAFNDARKTFFNERIQPMLRVIVSADQQTLERHAGDVFYYALHGQERMWRVEAILKLGRYRFNAGRIGDQRTAGKVMDELANDPDPIVKLAASTARELTLERYRMLR